MPDPDPLTPDHVDFTAMPISTPYSSSTDISARSTARICSGQHKLSLILRPTTTPPTSYSWAGSTGTSLTRELLERRLDLPVRQSPPTIRRGLFRGNRHGAAYEVPLPLNVGDEATVAEDVAHFYRGPNPFNTKRTVTICNAMYGRGTLGAVRTLTDARFRDRNEAYMSESRFANCRFIQHPFAGARGERTSLDTGLDRR